MAGSNVDSSTGVSGGPLEKRPIRVLLVDDELNFLRVSQQILEMQGGFQVETVSSVAEAMEKLVKTVYDVIVSDYQIPGKDGLQFLEELRDSGNAIPFILFTGKGREEVAVKALRLGADNYLNKNGLPETVYAELVHDIHTAVASQLKMTVNLYIVYMSNTYTSYWVLESLSGQ